jgi:hypothetical protein
LGLSGFALVLSLVRRTRRSDLHPDIPVPVKRQGPGSRGEELRETRPGRCKVGQIGEEREVRTVTPVPIRQPAKVPAEPKPEPEKQPEPKKEPKKVPQKPAK